MSFFFFSSRRRHTRSLRDWSSDVCSSDLELRHGEVSEFQNVGIGVFIENDGFHLIRNQAFLRAITVTRSEEHTSELQTRRDLVCRLLLEKKKRRAARIVRCAFFLCTIQKP